MYKVKVETEKYFIDYNHVVDIKYDGEIITIINDDNFLYHMPKEKIISLTIKLIVEEFDDEN